MKALSLAVTLEWAWVSVCSRFRPWVFGSAGAALPASVGTPRGCGFGRASWVQGFAFGEFGFTELEADRVTLQRGQRSQEASVIRLRLGGAGFPEGGKLRS